MLREFREFLLRGNVVDLAVGVIAGLVFGAVVNSLVEDVMLQLLAAVVGKPDFTTVVYTVNDTPIRVGSFLTALLNFMLTMACVFFFIVKPINALTDRIAPDDGSAPNLQRECPECLGEVPAAARRCRHCTIQLEPAA